MSWHYIIDDLTLGAHEVLVLLVIRRQQFGDRPVLLRQEVIATKARLSLRSAQSAIASAEAKGHLEIHRVKNLANFYRVVQKQGLLFSNANFHTIEKTSSRAPERATRGQDHAPDFPRSEENPVEMLADIEENSARPIEVHARGAPQSTFGTQDVRTFIRKSSGKPKDQNPAPEGGAAPPLVSIYDPDQKRRIEARNRRLSLEMEIIRESLAGMGPGTDSQVEAIQKRFEEKSKEFRPLSEEEYRRRRDDQKRRLAEYLQAKGARKC